jgi:hypothetical protein
VLQRLHQAKAADTAGRGQCCGRTSRTAQSDHKHWYILIEAYFALFEKEEAKKGHFCIPHPSNLED